MANTPLSRYQDDLQQPDFKADAAQALAVEHLQRLYLDLVNHKPPRKRRFRISKSKPQDPIKGLYFWGGVGRGKTYLVDTFYECLPFEEKLRIHFHRFMHRVHKERSELRDRQDPLNIIADRLAEQTRVLCFDEFVVNDVADAIILVKLLQRLFMRGVTLVATSNVEPKELYKGGLQRELFLPVIDSIYQHTDVLNIDSGVDYRLLFLDNAEIYFTAINDPSKGGLRNAFEHLAPDAGVANATIEIEGRELQSIRRADGVIWFDFSELCDGPRSQNDYIELARVFHSILLDNVPVMDRLKEDQARRFINLIDVLYDHNVKLIVFAAASVTELYLGTRVEFEFRRTVSRLQEMRSHDYLALPHKT